MAYTDFVTSVARRGFLERHPTASLWLIAGGQAVAMLGISLVLRALMS
jgi:hypothetical protein